MGLIDLGPGAYGILLTTFDEDDRVHDRDLQAQAEFVAATAQGVVWPVMASEFYVLGADEVAHGFDTAAGATAGRAPFVAGMSETPYGMPGAKGVLRRRGIVRSTRFRLDGGLGARPGGSGGDRGRPRAPRRRPSLEDGGGTR